MESKIVVVATNNEHKLREIKEILTDFEIRKASDFVSDFKPEENGDTFCENALIKAKALGKRVNMPVLADDSGLEVFALDGKPGIFSSRYSEEGTDEANVKKLLEDLEDKEDRRARFTCCMTLIIGNYIIQKEGHVYGTIIDEPRGKNGFGYDPVFVPDGFDRTFAQMSAQEKNNLSHRRRALELIKEELEALYG